MSVKKGDNISVHYAGTLNDGSEFDNSYKREEPIVFTAGSGQMIPGFDNAVIGMEVGEKKTIKIPSDEAYGPYNKDAIISLGKEKFAQEVSEGQMVQLMNSNGMPAMAKVVEVKESDIVLDVNHPLAGKDLNFDIELVSVN